MKRDPRDFKPGDYTAGHVVAVILGIFAIWGLIVICLPNLIGGL